MKSFFLLALVCCALLGCNRQNSPGKPEAQEQCANCAARLKMLDDAKGLWAQQGNKTTNDTPTMDELRTFLRGIPACPNGGTYTMTPVGTLTTCSFPAHVAYYQKSLAEKKTETP